MYKGAASIVLVLVFREDIYKSMILQLRHGGNENVRHAGRQKSILSGRLISAKC